MKRFYCIAVVILTFAAVLEGCNGGGGRRTSGRQCPLNYDPVSMNIPTDQKTNLDSVLPAGTYEYEGAKLYYVDPSNFRIELAEVRKLDGQFEAGISCVRNASQKLKGLTVVTQGISSMIVDGSSNKVTSEVKSFGFSITENKIDVDFIKTPDKPERPSDVFKGQVSESFLYSQNASTYEIRSHGKTANGGDFYLSVSFKKK